MSGLVLRAATEADRDDWLRLFRGYNGFYGVTLSEDELAASWTRLTDPDGGFFILLAVLDDVTVGLANCLVHPNSWSAAPDCYLEDLYVDPEARGRSIGRRLIETLAELRRERGWRKVWWKTAADNQVARRLYDRLAVCTDRVHYEILE